MLKIEWHYLLAHFQVLHSFAFGGRGCFFSGSRIHGLHWSSQVQYWETSNDLLSTSSDLPIGSGEPDRGSRIHSHCRRPCNRNTVLFLLFLSVLVVTAITSVFSFPTAFGQPLASPTVFDMTLGFPGEGPKIIIPDGWVDFHERKFSDTQVEAMARSIVASSGCGYKSVCYKLGYNFLPNGAWAQSNNPVYKRLQIVVRKLNRRNRNQENQRRTQMLKDANRLNATTAGKVIKVLQERDNLSKR